MFESQKTRIFWVGLTILGFASIVLFSTIWVFLTTSRAPFYYRNWFASVPFIVGSVVFILIGLYMMKSGEEKTTVFWAGLWMLGLASAVLFSTIWYFLTSSLDIFNYRNWYYFVPFIVGSIIFILIGLYMMTSGTE